VSDTTAPLLTGTAYEGDTGVEACMPSETEAAGLFDESKAIQGYTDTCGGTVTADLTGTVVTGDDCDWTVTYTYKVLDECMNEFPGQTYTRKGGNDAAPVAPAIPYAGTTGIDSCLPTQDAAEAAFDATSAATGYTDACGGEVTAELTDADVTGDDCAWTVTYTYKVVDDCDNELTGLTYTDEGGSSTAPTAPTVPYAGTTGIDSCMPTQTAAEDAFNATNAASGYTAQCGGTVTAELTSTVVSGDDCDWSVTYTYKVVDSCGNELTGQTYTDEGADDTAPTLNGQAYAGESEIMEPKPTQDEASAAFNASMAKQGYTDNCSGENVTAVFTNAVVSGTDYDWTVTYTFKVVDDCGNELTGLTYTDSGGTYADPELVGDPYGGVSGVNSCKDDAIAAAPFDATAALQGYVAYCGDLSLTAVLTGTEVTGTDCGWTITYTFKVVDDCDNELTDQSYANTGSDQTAPSLTGAPYTGQTGINASINDAVAAAPFNATLAKQGYTDNCSDDDVTAVLTDTEVTGVENDWTVTYIFKVVDLCGNELTGRSYSNTGGNQENPELVGDPYEGESGINSCKDNALNAAPFDETAALQGYVSHCGGDNLTAVLTGTSVSGTDCYWAITYSFKVVDDCGNELTGQSYTNTGGDQTPPVLTGNPYPGQNGIAGPKPSDAEAIVAFSSVMAENGYTDNCGGNVDALLTSYDITGTNCSWSVTYYFKVVDPCGNELTNQSYTNTGGVDIVLVNANTDCSSLNNLDQDLCLAEAAAFDPLTLEDDVKALYKDFGVGLDVQWTGTTQSPNNTDCNWSFVYTFEITDECENVVVCEVTYTGGDETPPELTGTPYVGESFSVDCEPTEDEIMAAYNASIPYALEAYTDSCDDDLTASFESYQIQGGNCIWVVVYTFSVSDACGNELADQSFTVTFTQIPPDMFVLTLIVSGEGSVEVTGTAYPTPIIVESGMVLITVEEGTVLDLSAFAETGWMFEEWLGDVVSENTEEQIVMDGSKTVTAVFGQGEVFVQNVTVDGEDCFDAPVNLIIAGDGTTFVVEETGSAQMVAGNSIILKPGTTITQGGYLLAYIDPESPFCGEMPAHFLAIDDKENAEEQSDEVLDTDDWQIVEHESFFTVYPNPTRDKFTLEFNRLAQDAMITVEVYGMRGERIIHQDVEADQQHIFSLESQQPGIYLVRVLWDGNMQVERILKRN